MSRLYLVYLDQNGPEQTHGGYDWLRGARREFERLSKENPSVEWMLVRRRDGKPDTIIRHHKPTKGKT